MSNKARIWDVIWQVVKFILTLGISHITKREDRRESEDGVSKQSDETPK